MADNKAGNAGSESPQTPLPAMTEMMEDWQHWANISLRAQQLLTSFGLRNMANSNSHDLLFNLMKSNAAQLKNLFSHDMAADEAAPSPLEKQFRAAGQMMNMWGSVATGAVGIMDNIISQPLPQESPKKDWRFTHTDWQQHPAFHMLRQIYMALSSELLGLVEKAEDLEEAERIKLKVMMQGLADSISPSNFVLTNPAVLERAIETRGESLLKGLEMMLRDLEKGQITQADPAAFQVGRNIANTPGKVIHRTALYELIHYTPRTPNQLAIPLVIFPAWINRFYILDLGEEKSFVRWALDQGIPVFMVSWKSADESMAGTIWDDYIEAQISAVDTACNILGATKAHTAGYCVAGTTLAATLAYLAAKGEAGKIASATFFTAQVDFTEAGELKAFISDENMDIIETLGAPGYVDGRYLAATFNLLRARDLIWQYVIHNYLMGLDYKPMDLLHWNGDSTNLPTRWHLEYLRDLYRDNLLVQPSALSIRGTPLDLSKIKTPCYIQSAKEDHIAPPQSVIKMLDHISAPFRFVLAGSGHIAGVVNPPSANKYQYWINEDAPAKTIEAFLAGAQEHAGSWWPDWAAWLRAHSPEERAVSAAYMPGEGACKAICDAPGEYVLAR